MMSMLLTQLLEENTTAKENIIAIAYEILNDEERPLYIHYKENIIGLSALIENDMSFEFYLEDTENKLFIEGSSTYTEDGKFIKSTTDTNFNVTTYDIDSTTGLLKSITDAKGNTTYNTYDTKDRPICITKGEKQIHYEYNEYNQLDKISQGNMDYRFLYDEFGRAKKVKIGESTTLVTNEYEENNGNLKTATYGNNHSISYDYDEFDRVKTVVKEDNTYHYKYDNNGDLVKIISNNEEIHYSYDLSKKLNLYRCNDFDIHYEYDKNNNIIHKKYQLDNLESSIHNIYNADDDITQTSIDGNDIHYQYDSLGRLVQQNINERFHTDYEYVTHGNRTSLLVKSIKNKDDKYFYRYDELNNITHIFHNGVLESKYTYGNDNDLSEEYLFPENTLLTYNYDNYGNIITRRYHKISSSELLAEDIFEYNNPDWRDQLTAYNGEKITYDEIGNPLTIGKNTLTWINGRQLCSYSNENVTIQYQYNMNGIRNSKIVNGIETKYYLEGNKIIFEKTNGNMLYYMRDNRGNLVGLKYNNDVYYYIKNIQNDIIGILDSNYQVVARYTYDGRGNILSVTDSSGNSVLGDKNHIANINPFRYRGYYYDRETGFYYLNSRYYNPTWGRFLNADGIIGANKDIYTYNLYAYCSNNSIGNFDNDGYVMTNFLVEISRYVNKEFDKILTYFTASVGNVLLDYPLATKMFQHAIYGNGKSLPSEVLSKLKDSIATSSVTKDKIKDTIKKSSSNSFYIPKETINYLSGDLHYAVGKANIEMTGTYSNGTWAVKVTVSDKYNFDDERKGFSFSNLVNNFGYHLSQSNMIVSYDWEVSYYVILSEDIN